MAESFLISLREGFEAALIVAIVLAYVRRQAPEQARAVWLGTFAAIGVAVVVGGILHLTVDGLEGVARLRTFSIICLLAAGLLTWMIFWMRSHARGLKGQLEGKAGAAIATGSTLGVALVAFAAVVREGLETALFLLSTTTGAGGGDVALGIVLGLAAATTLGVLIYRGSSHVDIRRFFLVTGGLVILFAAGLLAKAVKLAQMSRDLGSLNDAFYDVTSQRWLTGQTQSGKFLAGIFGWDPQPSVEQVVVYVAYLVPVAIAFFAGSRPRPVRAAEPVPAAEPASQPVSAST